MMNGAILMCDRIEDRPFNSNALFSLEGVRMALRANVSEKFDIYAYYSVESLGTHRIEFEMVHRVLNKVLLLRFNNQEVNAVHLRRGALIVTARDVCIVLKDKGSYAMDLKVNGVIYATLPVEVV